MIVNFDQSTFEESLYIFTAKFLSEILTLYTLAVAPRPRRSEVSSKNSIFESGVINEKLKIFNQPT